jgi:hypothetical protein
MAEPRITEVQEQIIEMEGVRYHLVNVAQWPKPPNQQSCCYYCDGHELTPEDPDRYRAFDHVCKPDAVWTEQDAPMLCCSREGWVYKRMDDPANTKEQAHGTR